VLGVLTAKRRPCTDVLVDEIYTGVTGPVAWRMNMEELVGKKVVGVVSEPSWEIDEIETHLFLTLTFEDG